MKPVVLCAVAAMTVASNSANADFQRWSADVESDPFSGGEKVMVEYMTTIRSGVFIICDTAESGVRIRAVPGFAYVADLDGFEPAMEFAFDGVRILGAQGTTGAVGDNLATAEVSLLGDQAQQFVKAFAAATKQVAIKDGISDQPHLLRASGSTKSGQALAACVEKQPK